jgi:hypothetical protein
MAIFAIFTLPVAACAKEPTQPVTNDTMIGYAYGYVLKGEPVIMIENDTLSIGGSFKGAAQPYYPRRSHAAVVVPCTDNAWIDELFDEAYAAAKTATDQTGWIDRFTGVLNAHLGNEVASFQPNLVGGEMVVWLRNGDDVHVKIPAEGDIGRVPKPFNNKDEIERQRQEFLAYVADRVWVFWGETYKILVPWQLHNITLEAMAKTAAGQVLTDAERLNTPFIDREFEADFRAHMETR